MKPTLDLDLLLDGWATLEPPSGFADRVLDASTPSRRWPIYACAAALLLVFLPLFAAPRGTHPAPVHISSVSAGVDDLDAGLRTD